MVLVSVLSLNIALFSISSVTMALNTTGEVFTNMAPPSFEAKKPVVEAQIPTSSPFAASSNIEQVELPSTSPFAGGSTQTESILNLELIEELEGGENVDSSDNLATDFTDGIPRVENIEVAMKGPNSVEVSFDEIAGVDTYFVLYGTNPVIEESDVYNMPPLDTLSSNTVEIADLEDGVTYYFSAVANFEDSYSEFFSDEVAIEISAADIDLPNLELVEALNTKVINVNFSMDMNFENVGVDNFNLHDTFNNQDIAVKIVSVLHNRSLNLVVDGMESGFEYVLKAIDLENTDSLGILEANTEFTFRAADLESLEELKVESVEVFDHKGLEISLNDEIISAGALKDNLNIVLKSDPNQIIEIENVLKNPNDSNKFLIVTKGFTAEEYQIIFLDVIGVNKGMFSKENSVFEFTGVNPPESELQNGESGEQVADLDLNDKTAPGDVRNLTARFVDEALRNLEINFDPSLDIDQDLARYELYFAKDGDNYFHFSEISKENLGPLTIQDLDLNADYYNIKVTAKDNNQNESLGSIFKLILPETGPASILSVFALSVLGSRRLTRSRRSRD